MLCIFNMIMIITIYLFYVEHFANSEMNEILKWFQVRPQKTGPGSKRFSVVDSGFAQITVKGSVHRTKGYF